MVSCLKYHVGVLLLLGSLVGGQPAVGETTTGASVATADQQQTSAETTPVEMELGSVSILDRSLQSGPVVFLVLLVLILMSVLSWAIVIGKFIYLRKISGNNDKFVKSFWDSRSLNDLNSRLQQYPYSPVREVFRGGYAELVRGSQLKESCSSMEWVIQAALENLTRALNKAKSLERCQMERFLSVLAITASASPFIGLFGTVWGIMSAFENIAQSGSTSLAAVAPGISEALIATAFGLAAAIPAVIGYNMANQKIRNLCITMDGFGADFLNIVERYFVSDKPKTPSSATSPAPRI